MASTSTNPPPPSPLFDLILRISMDFMDSNPRDSASSTVILNNSNTSCISKSHVEDLIQTLKYLFNQALITIQVASKQEVDPTTALATLESLMAAISRTTHHSTESVAQSTREDLRHLSLQSQDLQKKLVKHNSMASYLGITSTVAIGVAACAMPAAGLITVQPLSQLFSTLYVEWVINPLEGKLKVVEIVRFIIHSMIIKVAKLKDTVQDLVSLVAKGKDAKHQKKFLEEVEKAVVDALAQLEMVELELEIENLN